MWLGCRFITGSSLPRLHGRGTWDLVLHSSFAEYDRAIGIPPDLPELVVVPYLPYASPQDAAVLAWLCAAR